MKLGETIIKIGLAIAAVAGIAFLIVKYMDAIKASQYPDLPEDALSQIPLESVDMHYIGAVIFAFVGFFLVTGIEMLSKKFVKE